MSLCTNTLKEVSKFPTAFCVSSMWALLFFKARCFGCSFFCCRSQALGCQMWASREPLSPLWEAPNFWDHTQLWVTMPGVRVFWWDFIFVSPTHLDVTLLPLVMKKLFSIQVFFRGNFSIHSYRLVPSNRHSQGRRVEFAWISPQAYEKGFCLTFVSWRVGRNWSSIWLLPEKFKSRDKLVQC